MDRSLIDRWTDTTAFRIALAVSGALVLPVLALGVLLTVIGSAVLLAEKATVGLEPLAFGALSVGGVLGLVGYGRALAGARKPARHNVTATLVCLTFGVVTALIVAAYSVLGTLDGFRQLWASPMLVSLATLFTTANVVWALSGIAWMQRLPRRYTERTGRAFDGMPVLILLVAITLATAAALITTAF
jgi:hypothetical protein